MVRKGPSEGVTTSQLSVRDKKEPDTQGAGGGCPTSKGTANAEAPQWQSAARLVRRMFPASREMLSEHQAPSLQSTAPGLQHTN